MTADKQLVIAPGATRLFEEPGALPEVARLAAEWFTCCSDCRAPQTSDGARRLS